MSAGVDSSGGGGDDEPRAHGATPVSNPLMSSTRSGGDAGAAAAASDGTRVVELASSMRGSDGGGSRRASARVKLDSGSDAPGAWKAATMDALEDDTMPSKDFALPERWRRRPPRTRAERLVRNKWFYGTIHSMIVLNCLMIALETDATWLGISDTSVFVTFEHIFAAVFVVEIFIKVLAFVEPVAPTEADVPRDVKEKLRAQSGRSGVLAHARDEDDEGDVASIESSTDSEAEDTLKRRGNCLCQCCCCCGYRRFLLNSFIKRYWFDVLLVVLASVDLWVLRQLGTVAASDARAAAAITTMRVLRLLRIGRVMRIASLFQQLHMLVQGLLSAARPIFWLGVMITIVLFIFSVFATNIIGHDPAWEGDEVVQDWFGSIPASMYTLFQVMTLESWSMGIVRPLLEQQPRIWIFFVVFIVVTNLSILNLFTSVLVERTLTVADDSKLAERKKRSRYLERVERELWRVFRAADIDGDKSISRSEMVRALDHPRISQHLAALQLDPADVVHVFDQITFESAGATTGWKEFLHVFLRMNEPLTQRDMLLGHTSIMAAIARVDDTARQVREHLMGVELAGEGNGGEGALGGAAESAAAAVEAAGRPPIAAVPDARDTAV